MRRRVILAISIVVLIAAVVATVLRGKVGQATDIPRPVHAEAVDPVVQELADGAIAKIEAAPGDVMTWFELALIYEANSLYEAAERTFLRAHEIDDSIPQSWYHLALVRAWLGDPAAAIDAMRVSLRLNPENVAAQWHIGFWALDDGRLDEARTAFDAAHELSPMDEAPMVGLARLALREDQPAVARDLLEQVRRWGGGNAAYAELILADAYRRAGTPELIDTLSRLDGETKPDWDDPWMDEVIYFRQSVGALQLRAARLLADGQFDEAIAGYEMLREQHPDDVALLSNLAVAYERAGRLEEAIAVLRDAIERRPTSQIVRLNISSMLARRGELEEAIEHARVATAVDPRSGPAWASLGFVLLIDGRFDDARIAFVQAVENDPAQAGGHLGLAHARMELEQFDAALAALNDGAGRDDLDQARYDHLAFTIPLRKATHAMATGDVSGAIAQFEVLAATHPDNVPLLVNLGVALMQQGEAERAVVPLQRAAEIAPESLPVALNLAAACRVSGKLDAALEQALHAVELAPKATVPREVAASLLLRMDRPAAALDVLDGLEVAPTPSLQVLRGGAFIELGQLDAARAVLEPMLAQPGPQTTDVRRLLEQIDAMEAAPDS